MAVAYADSKIAALAAGATTIAVTMNTNASNGDYITGVVTWPDSAGTPINLSGVADSNGNTYTLIGSKRNDATNGQSAQRFAKTNVTGGGSPPVITATFDATSGSDVTVICGYRATGARTASTADDQTTDALQAAPGTGTDGVTTGSKTTTADGELIVAFAVDSGAIRTNQYTAGTNYTIRSQLSNGVAVTLAVEDKSQANAGAVAGTFTGANNDAALSFLVTVFAPAAGGGGTSGLSYLRRRKVA